MSAILSPDGAYRYLLQRGDGPQMGFVMLNPSTADAEFDDATIRKLRGFSKDWGYPSFAVANCYALRSTDPAGLRDVADPIGPANEAYLHAVASLPLVVVAWGKHASRQRVESVSALLASYGKPLFCLGTNGDGSPRHPLYVPYTQMLVEWRLDQLDTCK